MGLHIQPLSRGILLHGRKGAVSRRSLFLGSCHTQALPVRADLADKSFIFPVALLLDRVAVARFVAASGQKLKVYTRLSPSLQPTPHTRQKG